MKIVPHARLQSAFDHADAELNRVFMQVGGYSIPVSPSGVDVYMVRNWIVSLAISWLDDPQGATFEAIGDEIRRATADIEHRGLKIHAESPSIHPGLSWLIGNSCLSITTATTEEIA